MLILDKFKKDWFNYIMQSLIAAFVVLLVVYVFHGSEVVIATMGATTFICFAMPKTVSAKSVNVIGGHIVGLVCGALFLMTNMTIHAELPLAVGLAFFFMAVLDLEHPPAIGTTVAVIVNEAHLVEAVLIILSVSLICLCRYAMKSHIKDLI
ncbi:MAG: HPP family protein [Anaerohalosphaera sp.]|nr:HPP family protein [Anaerohalosphaera sp.]